MKGLSNIKPYISTHGSNSSNLSQKDFHTVKNPDLFITLLADEIKNRKDSDRLNAATLPLNKNFLQRLIHLVKVQMDNYLFRELSGLDEDSDLPGFNCQRISLNRMKDLKASFALRTEHDSQQRKEIKSTPEVDHIIENASKIYDVDPALIKSVIRAESDFDANATSSKGAMGLMQLMPDTAKDLGVKNCYNPVENIMAGTRYLKSLLSRYDGNVELSLAAYNWGMGNLERHPDKLPKETRTYIVRVNGYLQKETS